MPEEEKKLTKQETEDATRAEVLQKTIEASERLEKANAEHKVLMDQQEVKETEDTLAGTAEAGKETQTEEQLEIAQARKLIEGTGFEDRLFPQSE